MQYSLEFTETFWKKFAKIKDKKLQYRIIQAILGLKNNPKIGKKLIMLKHTQYGQLYRIRISKFRVIYAINNDKKNNLRYISWS